VPSSRMCRRDKARAGHQNANPVRGPTASILEWRMFLTANRRPHFAGVCVSASRFTCARVRSGSKLRSGDAFAESPFDSASRTSTDTVHKT